MKRLHDVSLTGKIAAFVGIFLTAFVAFVVITYRTAETVQVNGPLYSKVVEGKDLIADVLPPPEYIIETYLVVLELKDERDPAKVERLIQRGRELRRDYERRHDFWVKQLEPGEMKHAMVERAYRPAMAFFETRDAEYVPAIMKGDRERAATLAAGPLKERYQEHRSAVDDVVRMAIQADASYEREAAQLVSSRENWLLTLAVGIVGLVFFMAWAMHRVVVDLARRLSKASEVAKQVAEGDLTAKLVQQANDEAGTLLSSIGTMTENLGRLVTRVKQSSISVMSTATQIASTSKQQEEAVSGFSASTTEIAAAVKQIDATGKELAATIGQVSEGATRTAELAVNGRSGLTDMDQTMHQLERATGSISSKLAAIREKASAINLVVTTITKVADQTNLLSVNAAIEAEKAGEYGLGFLVVAREIRRLADQAAVSTLDIEQMVRQMQDAVSAGVMEMDKFNEEVRRGVGGVAKINGQLGQIIEQVQALSERMDAVNEGMRSQALGASQINDAMTQLTEGARQTSASIREFDRATNSLRGAVSGLNDEVSRFILPA